MKISFVSSNTSLNLGSYRIWVHGLCELFKDLGHVAVINKSIDKNTDIIILSKSDWNKAPVFKKDFPDAKIGLINPASTLDHNADFVIVGSVEEMCSMSSKENVFMYPLIEKMYQNVFPKKHSDNEKLVIGFHGHFPHLAKFDPYLKSALEEFEKECDFKLLVVTTENDQKWPVGKPKIKDLEIVKWKLHTACSEISRMDIGLIPNMTNIKPQDGLRISTSLGLYNTDYMVRFKNKSNAGRMFVFMQLGIPVIADITPSNIHLLGNLECGYLAMDKDGWLNGLRALRDSKERMKVSKLAYDAFYREYDSHIWAERLIDKIKGVK